MNSSLTSSIDLLLKLPTKNVSILYIGNISIMPYQLATLEQLNVSIKHIDNAKKVVNEINNFLYDVIFCDYDSDGINAIKLYALLKENTKFRSRFIAVSQKFIPKQQIAQALELNIDDVVFYPLNKPDLSDKINWLLNS